MDQAAIIELASGLALLAGIISIGLLKLRSGMRKA